MMSDTESKIKKSKRIHDEQNHIKKRARVIRERSAYLWPEHAMVKQPHRLHKISGVNCGNPNCFLCGNPRKIFHERTIQEQSFEQEKLWSEE